MLNGHKEMEQIRNKMVATNCFAFEKKDCSCRALKCLDCRKCKFFKTKNKFEYDALTARERSNSNGSSNDNSDNMCDNI